MIRNTRLVRGLVVTCLFFMTACGNSYTRTYLGPAPSLQSIAVVAVLPFENLTDYPNAGDIVADLVATELFSMGRYKVIDSDTSEKLYGETGGVVMMAPDRTYAQDVGRAIRADAVVYGAVQEYAYRLDKTRQDAREPAVAITVRMVEVATGQTLWASSQSRASDAFFTRERDPVNRIASLIVRDMKDELSSALITR